MQFVDWTAGNITCSSKLSLPKQFGLIWLKTAHGEMAFVSEVKAPTSIDPFFSGLQKLNVQSILMEWHVISDCRSF